MAEGDDQFDVPRASVSTADISNRAENEAIAMAKGMDLNTTKTAQLLNRLNRTDALDGHLHRLVICALYFIFILMGITIIFIFVHYTNICNWMKPEQVDKLVELLTTGAVGGAIATVAKSRLGFESRNIDS